MPSLSQSVFFHGDVLAAINEAKQRKAVLVVLVVDESCKQAQQDAFEQAQQDLTSTKAVVICLQQGTQFFAFFNEYYPVSAVPSVFFIDPTSGKQFLKVEAPFDLKSIVQKTKVFQKLLESKLQQQLASPITPTTPQQQQAQFVPAQQQQPISSPQPQLTVAPTPPRQEEATTSPTPITTSNNTTPTEVPSMTAEEVARKRQQEMEDVKKRLAAKYKAERETPIAPPVEQVISATDSNVKISTQSKEKREAMKILNQRIASNQRDLRPDVVGTPVPKTPTTTTTTTTTTPTPSSSSKKSPFTTTTTTLVLRFPDGTSIKQEFQISDTLQQVRAFVDTIIGVGHAYNIKTTFPSKTLAETNDTLEQLNLVPNATLAIEMVVKRKQVSDVSTEAQWSVFSWLCGMFAGFFKKAETTTTSATTTTTTTTTTDNGPTQHKMTTQQKKKFASLSDLQNKKEDDDKSERDLWNGNSTQFQDKK